LQLYLSDHSHFTNGLGCWIFALIIWLQTVLCYRLSDICIEQIHWEMTIHLPLQNCKYNKPIFAAALSDHSHFTNRLRRWVFVLVIFMVINCFLFAFITFMVIGCWIFVLITFIMELQYSCPAELQILHTKSLHKKIHL